MAICKICLKKKSPYVMNNKLVCLHCDELLLDLEIETGDSPVRSPSLDRTKSPTAATKRPKTTSK